METATRKIKWIIKNATEENVREHDTNNRISSETFPMSVGENIHCKWYFYIYTKDQHLGIYLTKLAPPKNEKFSVHCRVNISTLSYYFECDSDAFHDGYGYGKPNFITIAELCNKTKAFIDNNNNLLIDIEITLKKLQNDEPKKPANEQPNVTAESFANFLDDEATSDFSIVCSDKVKIPVHQILLINKSPAFKKIFDEMRAQQRKVKTIKDVDSVTMKEILKYIYTGNANLANVDLVAKIYRASKIFDLAELQLQCVDALSNLICADNALDILKIANDLNLADIEKKCLSVILNNLIKLKKSLKWRYLSVALKEKVFEACTGYIPSITLETVL